MAPIDISLLSFTLDCRLGEVETQRVSVSSHVWLGRAEFGVMVVLPTASSCWAVRWGVMVDEQLSLGKAATGTFSWVSNCVNTKEQSRCTGKETSIHQQPVQPAETISVPWQSCHLLFLMS